MLGARKNVGDLSREIIWDPTSTDADITSQIEEALSLWKLLPYLNLTANVDEAVASYIKKLPTPFTFFSSSSPMWLTGVKKLSWDSDFFEMGVGRLEPLMSISSAAPSAEAAAAGMDVIARSLEYARVLDIQQLAAPVHCADSLTHLCLERAGFHLMDTIVTYHLKTFEFVGAEADPSVRQAEMADLAALAEISGECFANRIYNVNRFNSDAQFETSKVRELYSLWLKNSLTSNLADIVFTYVADGRPVGFVTASLPTQDDATVGLRVGRIPLNAVHPDYQGRGIYTKLAKAAIRWLRAQHAEIIEIKTQLPNAGVHRTWCRLGAQSTCAFHTFHLNLNLLQNELS